MQTLEEDRINEPRARNEKKKPAEDSESNYDEEYDDVIEEDNNVDVDAVSKSWDSKKSFSC